MADSLLNTALSNLNVGASENPYGIGASTLAGVAPALINPYGKVGTNLGIGLGSVLLSALLGYQSRQQAAEESITTSKLANELMSLETPEQRVAKIESVQGDLAPRLTSRLLNFNTALQAQEKANALDVAKAKALEEAKLQVEMSPLGDELFNRQITRYEAQQNAIFNRQKGMEDITQTNRLERDAARIQADKDAAESKIRLKALFDAGKLPAKTQEEVSTAIDFGNAAESIIDEFDLENMSPLEYKAKMANTGFATGLRRALIQRVQPYRIAVTGMAAGKAEDRDIQIVFGQAPFSGPEEFIRALRSLKEAAAAKADASLASSTMRPQDIYQGLQQMRTPGGRFSFAPMQQRFVELQDALGNTPASTPTPIATADIGAEIADAEAKIDAMGLPPEKAAEAKAKIRARAQGL
jgi:hypothetical protein